MADNKESKPSENGGGGGGEPRPLTEGHIPLKKGWQPAVQGGYQPATSEGGKPPTGGGGGKEPEKSEKKD